MLANLKVSSKRLGTLENDVVTQRHNYLQVLTEVINLRFPDRGIASLAQVSTMGLCPLRKDQKVPYESKKFT